MADALAGLEAVLSAVEDLSAAGLPDEHVEAKVEAEINRAFGAYGAPICVFTRNLITCLHQRRALELGRRPILHPPYRLPPAPPE
jgi:hypothetical protein